MLLYSSGCEQPCLRVLAVLPKPTAHTFSSSRVKPLPRRCLVLYLMVWARTTGFSEPAAGLGKQALALSARAVARK
jgi:hypothetical protein